MVRQIGPLDLRNSTTAANQPLVGSEDCLYLNVWTPANLTTTPTTPTPATLPVMVFIHGGAYVTQSASLFDYDGLSWSNASNVVIVTFDYRLGTMGFFASSDLDVEYGGLGYAGYSGNQGLLDQQMALRWVHSNIAAFGGQTLVRAITRRSRTPPTSSTFSSHAHLIHSVLCTCACR